MGVPFLFGTLARWFPSVVSTSPPSKHTDVLYVDFNAMIHTAYASVRGHDEDAMIREVIAQVHASTSLLKGPTETYLAMDGVAPRSKQEQQRRRRFMMHRTREEVARRMRESRCCTACDAAAADVLLEWDTNAISPGTAFMRSVSRACRELDPSVVLSSDLEAGEGEQKIVSRLRERLENHPSKTVAVVQAADADVILMCLLVAEDFGDRLSGLYVMRDDKTAGRAGTKFVDVLDLRRVLEQKLTRVHYWQRPNPNRVRDRCRAGLMREFVAATFLLGNDFLPRLSYLDVNDSILTAVINAARKGLLEPDTSTPVSSEDSAAGSAGSAGSSGSSSPAAGSAGSAGSSSPAALWNIHPRSLAHMTRKLARREPQMLGARLSVASVPPVPCAQRCTHRDIENYRESIMLDVATRPIGGDYYEYVAHAYSGNSMDVVDNLCAEYVRGVKWSVDYFINGVIRDALYVPGVFAPTLADLSTHCERIMAEQIPGRVITARLHGASDPPTDSMDDLSVQTNLLLILPYRSAILITNPIVRRVMVDHTLGCAYMYPVDVPITSHRCVRAWQCAPLLPTLDLDSICRGLTRAWTTLASLA